MRKRKRQAVHVPETAVVRLWKRRLQKERALQDAQGKPLEVIYPGRQNDGRGGDFRDAVIESGNELRFGNIEVHTSSRGWHAHGHDLDPNYNEVVLHVALKKEGEITTLLQNGQRVPLVVLGEELKGWKGAAEKRGPDDPVLTCRISGIKGLERFLERAGSQRFEDKTGHFKTMLDSQKESQCLYLGILDALGYSRNRIPFGEFGKKVNIEKIASFLERTAFAGGPQFLQALLLGKAGLLSSQRGNDRQLADPEAVLEKIWAGLAEPAVMAFRDWDFYKVRPVNNPVSRMIALSLLLRRCFRLNRLHGIPFVSSVLDPLTLPAEIENAFKIRVRSGSGYLPPYLKPGQTLLGKDRAGEIAVNILLPFLMATSLISGDEERAARIEECYLKYPAAGVNSIQRHMCAQLSLKTGQINSACRQQGLLYIFKTLCTRGRCEECKTAALDKSKKLPYYKENSYVCPAC